VSVRHSEYERIANDLYVTPRWVYEALYEVEPWAKGAWDCAPVNSEFDFLDESRAGDMIMPGIATNPPFSLAEQFCCRACCVAKQVAMLLPYAFDAAKSRRYLFETPPFKIRYNLTKRIRWENLEQKKAGPSQNHAWYVWDWNYSGPPMVGWLPMFGGGI
jgi:hypothetical protein